MICGRLLGAKDKNKASEVFSQTMVTASVICILTSLAVFLMFSPILKILRADGELSVYFTGYYSIMLFTYPLMVIGTILGMFIRADGKPQVCMLVSIASCVLNAVLDFIPVGRLSMSVEGSAIICFKALLLFPQMAQVCSLTMGMTNCSVPMKDGYRICLPWQKPAARK